VLHTSIAGALGKVGAYVSVDEVMAEIEKDELFYRKSGEELSSYQKLT